MTACQALAAIVALITVIFISPPVYQISLSASPPPLLPPAVETPDYPPSPPLFTASHADDEPSPVEERQMESPMDDEVADGSSSARMSVVMSMLPVTLVPVFDRRLRLSTLTRTVT